MKLYIAGPMTGLPDYNYPAFDRAEAILTAAGYEVVNPTVIGHHDGWSHEDYLKAALALMVGCDGIALLPGWEHSKGVLVEVAVAIVLPWLTDSVREIAWWIAEVLPTPAREEESVADEPEAVRR